MTTAAFDTLAARYDELWTESPAGRAQRELVWRELDPRFHPGQRILDIGCGTGADAAHFAARGVDVEACDASPAMVARAAARGGFQTRLLRIEELSALDGPYDGALSNFGALNCVENLRSIATDLAPVIRRGGTLALCTLGRFCAWEMAHYAAHGKFQKAWRRVPGMAPSSLGITVRYPTVSQLAAAFHPEFTLQVWLGVGVVTPPSYVQLPARVTRWCGAADRRLARVPLLRAAADHRLLIFLRA